MCLFTDHRLRMESPGGEHLCGLIRLEMQRYMQLSAEHRRSAQQVWRKRKGTLGRFFLTQPGGTPDRSCSVVVYKCMLYIVHEMCSVHS
jgi:hypothetical protein